MLHMGELVCHTLQSVALQLVNCWSLECEQSSIRTPPSQLELQKRGESYYFYLVIGGTEHCTSPFALVGSQVEMGPSCSGWHVSRQLVLQPSLPRCHEVHLEQALPLV